MKADEGPSPPLATAAEPDACGTRGLVVVHGEKRRSSVRALVGPERAHLRGARTRGYPKATGGCRGPARSSSMTIVPLSVRKPTRRLGEVGSIAVHGTPLLSPRPQSPAKAVEHAVSGPWSGADDVVPRVRPCGHLLLSLIPERVLVARRLNSCSTHYALAAQSLAPRYVCERPSAVWCRPAAARGS